MDRSVGKKVVLFVVEGISDKKALNPILSEILQSDQVYFEVVHGDLTSNYKEDTSSTIINSIVEIVNSYLTNSNFHVSDLLEVIFIIDMDGAYIKERSIIHQDIEKVIYTNKEILTKHTKELHMRNLVKTGNLDKFSKTAYLTIRNEQINFEIYYMSCNLDHVLYDERNLDIHMKNNKADVFADQFEGKGIEFIKFLEQFLVHKTATYQTSWLLIKNKTNSLNRFSNLAIYLNKKVEK